MNRGMIESLESRTLLSLTFAQSQTTTTSDGGGAVISQPQVALVYWGSGWNGTQNPSSLDVIGGAGAIVTGPYLRDLSAYGHSFGNGAIFNAYFITNSSPATNFIGADVQAMLTTNVNNNTLPRPTVDANLLYVVVPQAGSIGPGAGQGSHTFFTDNQSHKCHFAWVTNPGGGDLDSITYAMSHEIVESMTDPEGTAIQVDPRNATSWNEISDGSFPQNHWARVGGYLLQSYWLQS